MKSKELEALRNFISECENDWKTQPKRWVDGAINSNVSKYMDSLKSILTPPTADEVCSELDKWYIEATGDLLIASINDFTYDGDEKRFYKRMLNKPHKMTICRLDTNDCVQLREPLPPHLITMIGKFYESLEELENDK